MSFQPPEAALSDGSRFAIGIVAARFNPELVDGLLARTVAVLDEARVRADRREVVRVAGSFEIPYAVNELARSGRFDACIALGVLVRGDTSQYELTARSVGDALQRIVVDSRIPVVNGVMIADTPAQAKERCLGAIDRGGEFARAALEMAALRQGFNERGVP